MKRKGTIVCAKVGAAGIALIMCSMAGLFGHKHLLASDVPPVSREPNWVSEPIIPIIDVSTEIAAMQKSVTEVNMPKDTQIAPSLSAAIQETGLLWQEWRTLVDSGKIRIRPWQGVNFASGSWKSPDGKAKISLLFRSNDRRIIDSKKRVYSSEGEVEQFYWLRYYEESGTIEYCELGHGEILWFHPGSKISCYARKLKPAKEGWETWYEVEWDKSGKIVREQTRTCEIPKLRRIPQTKGAAEKHQYKQDMARIKNVEKSFKPGQVNNLEEYEKFADEIQKKWSRRNKEYYARLMLEICGPLSSGTFEDDRRYDLARKYALSVLADANDIPLKTELELTGHVMTSKYTRNAPKGEDFVQRRKKDVEIRLHAWRRLIDAIDPGWDPNEVVGSPNSVGALMGLPSGVSPESIGDPKLRAEYEAALQKNREQIERLVKQYRLHDWLKSYPKRAERYIVQMYSQPPFNLEELKQYLGKYAVDEKTRARILAAVPKIIEKQTPKEPSTR